MELTNTIRLCEMHRNTHDNVDGHFCCELQKVLLVNYLAVRPLIELFLLYFYSKFGMHEAD